MLSRLLDTLAPRLCAACTERLAPAEDTVCTLCNLHLPRTGYQADALGNEMARLFWGLIPVERAAALFHHEAGSPASFIIYNLKYGHRPTVALAMGRLLARELLPTGFFSGIDAIVPVPLAPVRQRQRGYNQSLLLARGISRATGLPVVDGAVCRTSFTASQTQKHLRERIENVENVFQLVSADSISGRHVLLVDDVVTTGATVTACARQLLRAPGVRLSVLSLCYAKS